METKAKTLDTVRERERELHFSNRKCSSFNEQFITSSIKLSEDIGYKYRDNIILPCGFYDTG